MKEKVLLNAQELQRGINCPVCGGTKTDRARTCRKCYETIGGEATKAVDAVVDAIAEATEGHMDAMASDRSMGRGIMWSKVLAQVEIAPGATLMKPKNGIQPYWQCELPVYGGHISLFIFGAENELPGNMVTAMVELKTKVIQVKNKGDMIIHYLRAQAVAGVSSNAELVINSPDKPGYRLDQALPSSDVTEFPRHYIVGFTAVRPHTCVTKEVDEESAAMLAKYDWRPGQ
jgi:ribosomal protein L40E